MTTDPLPRIGKRIVLRRLCKGDLRQFQAYRHDEDVGRYQGWTPESDADAEAFLDRMASIPLFPLGDWVQIGIADRFTKALIGDIGICLAADRSQAEIGITLRAKSQGRGLATEAVLETFGLLFDPPVTLKIIAITDARNARSIQLLERIGMTRTGTETALFQGEECLEYHYAISRDHHRHDQKRHDPSQSSM